MSDARLSEQETRQIIAMGGIRAERLFLAVAAELQRQLAEARAILKDLLEERGLSWLAQLAGRREELKHTLRRDGYRTDGEAGCSDCNTNEDYLHDCVCDRADLLRVVGGPEETQRQVDAAHKAAVLAVGSFGSNPTTYDHWRNAPLAGGDE